MWTRGAVWGEQRPQVHTMRPDHLLTACALISLALASTCRERGGQAMGHWKQEWGGLTVVCEGLDKTIFPSWTFVSEFVFCWFVLFCFFKEDAGLSWSFLAWSVCPRLATVDHRCPGTCCCLQSDGAGTNIDSLGLEDQYVLTRGWELLV